jgi:hypothetical protein
MARALCQQDESGKRFEAHTEADKPARHEEKALTRFSRRFTAVRSVAPGIRSPQIRIRFPPPESARLDCSATSHARLVDSVHG